MNANKDAIERLSSWVVRWSEDNAARTEPGQMTLDTAIAYCLSHIEQQLGADWATEVSADVDRRLGK